MAYTHATEDWSDIPTTRRFPRTLEEAFGVGERGNIWEPVPELEREDRIVMAACMAILVAFIVTAVLA